MNIWHMSGKVNSSLLLFRSEKYTFRVIRDGEYTSVISGGNHYVIHNRYQQLFLQLPDQVTVQPVIIRDHQFNTETHDYIELTITNQIEPSAIRETDSRGNKIWKCNGYIFVSGQLKKQLSAIKPGDLEFTLGFSHFAGADIAG